MRSSSGGLWTTLLMFVPLVAVPALAIFGVPNPNALKASLDTSATPALDLDEPALGEAAPASRPRPGADDMDGFLPAATTSLGDGTEDPFLEVSSHLKNDKRRAANDHAGQPGNGPAPGRIGANTPSRISPEETEISPFSPAGSADVRDAPSESPPAAGHDVADPARPVRVTTLTAATRRLQELGITDYQLAPGEAPNGFLFTCIYRLPDNPRITHRFEAEAAEPLEAVQDVLGQVENFMRRR